MPRPELAFETQRRSLDVDPRAQTLADTARRPEGAKMTSTPAACATCGILRFVARIRRKVLRVAELRRVHEDAGDDDVAHARGRRQTARRGPRAGRPWSGQARWSISTERSGASVAAQFRDRADDRSWTRRARHRAIQLLDLRARVRESPPGARRPSPSRRAQSGPSARTRCRSSAASAGASAFGGNAGRFDELPRPRDRASPESSTRSSRRRDRATRLSSCRSKGRRLETAGQPACALTRRVGFGGDGGRRAVELCRRRRRR